MEKSEILRRLNPYVKEVCPSITTLTSLPWFAVSNITFCIGTISENNYHWFASYSDLKKASKEFYELGLERIKEKYNGKELKKEIIEWVKKVPEWNQKNDQELKKITIENFELMEKWWNAMIIAEGIKFCDIELFVDPFIKNKNLNAEEIALFKEGMHLEGIDRETYKEITLIEFLKNIKKGISKEEFDQSLCLNPKYAGYDGYKLYEKEELKKIDLEKLEEKIKNKKNIDPDKALEKLEKTIEINKKEKEWIMITRYSAYIIDERRYFANLMLLCSHILIEEWAKRMNVNKKEIYKLTHKEFLESLEKEKIIEIKSPRFLIKNKVVLNGEKAFEYYKELEKEIEKSSEKEKTLKGFGASKGKIKGKVRIVLDPRESKLKQGEILVTYFTNPEFVPLMKKASGIITESGGVTSHAAIVSRELGIPCIVGVKKAVVSFVEGEEIELNGETGKIIRLNHK